MFIYTCAIKLFVIREEYFSEGVFFKLLIIFIVSILSLENVVKNSPLKNWGAYQMKIFGEGGKRLFRMLGLWKGE